MVWSLTLIVSLLFLISIRPWPPVKDDNSIIPVPDALNISNTSVLSDIAWIDNALTGVSVPIPTLPSCLILILLVPLVTNYKP